MHVVKLPLDYRSTSLAQTVYSSLPLRVIGVQPDHDALPCRFFFVDFFFHFLALFEFLLSFSVPTAKSIIFGNKNNDDKQDFRKFTGDCLFTSVSFTVNHDPASSLFADGF
jgi:hypothetical protein